jgi:predicted DNA-binding antitoxin AbrB/MazE fold protein
MESSEEGASTMVQTIEAVCENGAFRPLRPETAVPFEGQRVRLTIEAEAEPDILRLAHSVYEGLSDVEIAEIEKIALDRRRFFRDRELQ